MRWSVFFTINYNSVRCEFILGVKHHFSLFFLILTDFSRRFCYTPNRNKLIVRKTEHFFSFYHHQEVTP